MYNCFQEVPTPTKHLVTRWGSDQWSDMAYSYLPVGADGRVYDKMAAEVQAKVHFAGEVRNI